MKYLDFIAQTLIIVLAIALLFFVDPDEQVIAILSVQFLLGVCQMISCFASLLLHSAAYKQRQRHFTLALIYLFLLLVAASTGAGNDLTKEVIFAALIGPSWTLGIYYYIITCRITFPSTRKSSSFLPHINF